MAFFSICSLLVDTDIIPSSYLPFLLQEDNSCENVDLIIRRSKQPFSSINLIKTADLPDMIIWKDISPQNEYSWIFEARNGLFKFLVDKEYTRVMCYNIMEFNSINMEFDDILGIYLGIIIECKLVQRGFAVLHSACVELNGVAYAFTGPSGIGKSTRARKWCELLSAEWISGDRPAIHAKYGLVYGVPWDGKEKIYRNVQYPLGAILKVNRSVETRIVTLSNKELLRLLCEQSFVPLWDTGLAEKSLQSLIQLINRVTIIELSCDITNESCKKAYEIVTSYIEEKRKSNED